MHMIKLQCYISVPQENIYKKNNKVFRKTINEIEKLNSKTHKH